MNVRNQPCGIRVNIINKKHDSVIRIGNIRKKIRMLKFEFFTLLSVCKIYFYIYIYIYIYFFFFLKIK